MHPMKEDNPMSNEANERHIADDPSLWWKQAVVYQSAGYRPSPRC